MKKKVDSQIIDPLDSLFLQALRQRIFPGAAMGIEQNKKSQNIKLMKFYGRASYGSAGREVDSETIYDLASLTKPLATTLCAMVLLEQSQLRLTDELVKFFPQTQGKPLGKVTLLQLLSHSSGLPGYRPYFINHLPIFHVGGKRGLLNAIFKGGLSYPSGEKCVYSDLGFILLGEIIATVSGQSLDEFFTNHISRPLGLEHDIFFRPIIQHYDGAVDKRDGYFAPTEYCRWRGRVVQGVVGDENSYVMGGVSGHAGLFGTLKGVCGLCAAILDHWRGEKMFPDLSVTMMNHCLQQVYPHSQWCLGFDSPSPRGSSAGKYFSPESVGHLGFTGTSFWLDKARGLSVVLLTNRVHPSRYNLKIRAFRPLFHDSVMELIDQGEGG